MEIEDLKCCGNCKHLEWESEEIELGGSVMDYFCSLSNSKGMINQSFFVSHCCKKWEFDNCKENGRKENMESIQKIYKREFYGNSS
jgi:hypothetical protein